MRYSEDMAKPTKTPMTFEREKMISVRLTPDEHDRLTRAADEVGLKISQYLRVAALEKARREATAKES
jgi:uncharacterized protein (DUF1778 family)